MIIFNWYIHIMLQGPAMLPTTITSEVTQLKEKVRVLEVRFLQSVWVNSVECQILSM